MRTSRALVALAVGAASVGALATTAAQAATPPTVVVLPVFGSTLTVTVTTNPDGTLNNVSLDKASDYTAGTPGLHHITFTHTTGNAGKVSVRAKNGSQSVSARVGTLKDIEGSGSWSGSAFNASDTETVKFTIGDDGGTPAKPTVKIDSASGTGATATIDTTAPKSDDEDHDACAIGRVTFAMGDQVRKLSVVACVDMGDDEHDSSSAKLWVGLGPSRIDASKVTIGADQTWTGQDCKGNPLTATFKVNPDGSISVSAPTTGVTTSDKGAIVDFGSGVKLFISAKIDGGNVVRERVTPKYRCKGVDPQPTTNVSVVPGSGWSDHNWGDHPKHP